MSGQWVSCQIGLRQHPERGLARVHCQRIGQSLYLNDVKITAVGGTSRIVVRDLHPILQPHGPLKRLPIHLFRLDEAMDDLAKAVAETQS